jgi:hypothetical protein
MADLAISWHRYRDQVILTEGFLYCVDETYCAFSRRGVRSISVDISALPTSDQHRLVKDCYDGCSIKLVGKVDLEYLVASNVLVE